MLVIYKPRRCRYTFHCRLWVIRVQFVCNYLRSVSIYLNLFIYFSYPNRQRTIYLFSFIAFEPTMRRENYTRPLSPRRRRRLFENTNTYTSRSPYRPFEFITRFLPAADHVTSFYCFYIIHTRRTLYRVDVVASALLGYGELAVYVVATNIPTSVREYLRV